jgi:predicted O-methyltransferase YrrM
MVSNRRSPVLSFARRVLPKPAINLLTWQREAIALRSVASFDADFSRLRALQPGEVAAALDAGELDEEWVAVRRTLEDLRIWNAPGTTGADDIEPLYRLARHFRARSILEVGTHIGGSTIALATAMRKHAGTDVRSCRLVSVDVIDVNDRERGPWIAAGATAPPGDCMRDLGLDATVAFRTSDSIEFLRDCTDAFDFVFFDGDHAAKTVYREIGLVAARLAPDAIVALHDYSTRVVFSTYDDGRTIPGPHLATRRVISENPSLAVIPVSRLPQERDRSGSYVALLGRAHAA